MGHRSTASGEASLLASRALKVSPLVIFLVGALVAALAWGTCNAGRASDAEIKLAAALAAQRDAATHWTAARDSLMQANTALRADSAFLDAQRRATRVMAKDSIGKLLAQIGDTTARSHAAEAVRVVYLEVEACQDQLANCEHRAANAEARAAGDSVLLAQTVGLLQQTEAAWRSEQRKNAPGFLGLRRFWQARSWTVPLAAVTTLLLIRK